MITSYLPPIKGTRKLHWPLDRSWMRPGLYSITMVPSHTIHVTGSAKPAVKRRGNQGFNLERWHVQCGSQKITVKRQSRLSFHVFVAVPMGRAFFRCRLFWAPRILNASFESTLEIRDGIWWMLRLVAVLHLASGPTGQLHAAFSLCFTFVQECFQCGFPTLSCLWCQEWQFCRERASAAWRWQETWLGKEHLWFDKL